jgi:hypothetical protein
VTVQFQPVHPCASRVEKRPFASPFRSVIVAEPPLMATAATASDFAFRDLVH